MYNPSRGGVRGGADQFTWESVKMDKHRENYLGHSLKAPVGRWQKGKDLSWFAKERKDTEDAKIADKSELAAIKRAEQEAMLIALGHNVIRKENPSLTKEEMTEALKRNIGDRDQLNIERVDGVGAKSGRTASLTGTRSKNDGVTFETHNDSTAISENSREESPSVRRSKNKKSKKHKKEKKKKNHKSGSDYSENEQPYRKEYMNDRTLKKTHITDETGDESFSKPRHKKEKKTRKRHDLSDSNKYQDDSSSSRRHRNEETKQRHDTEESDDSSNELTHRHKQRKENKRKHYSNEPLNSDFCRSHEKTKLKEKHNIYKRESGSNSSKHKSIYKHQNLDDSANGYHKNMKDKCKGQIHDIHAKRRRHDTSESD